jgi:hypothetical protein
MSKQKALSTQINANQNSIQAHEAAITKLETKQTAILKHDEAEE